MNLPFLGSKKEIKEYFLALILSLGEVRGILFEKTPGGLTILRTSKEEFEGSLDSLTADKLIEISDVVISDVEKSLPQGVEFDKVIFVVPHSWVVGGKIVKEHLLKLKTLCEALRLTPIGFIVSIEAIAAFLHKKEGVPVTAVFAEIGKKHVTLSIVKNGSVVYIADEEIKETEISSVEEILSVQDATEVLPSKIILLNFDRAKKLEQAFITHQWSKKLQFLHIPKVEVLSTGIESQAVISGVAAQMGFNTVENATDISAQESEKIIPEENKDFTHEDEILEETAAEREEGTLHFNGERVGFFKESDVAEAAEIEIAQKEPEARTYESNQEKNEAPEYSPAVINKGSLMDKIPAISLPSILSFRGKKSFLYPVLAVIILIAIIFAYYFLFEKVEVVMVLDKEEVKKDLTVQFSKDKDTSAKDSIIHVNIKQIEENGKEEKPATGKKETGEEAKGEVTILSSVNKETSIEKGTVLTSSNSLKFTLDSDVKIASSSGISDIKSAKGKVTAEEIGKEYNLPSSTKFTVGGFDKSSVEGKNDSAFSGGSKKEIKVVSQDDIDSLTSKIVSSLSKKAIEKAVSQKGEKEEVLTIPLGYTFDEKVFSKEEGEEADNVTLAATISYDMGYYDNDDIAKLAKEISGDGVSEKYNYSGKDSKVIVEDIEEKENGQISGKVSFSSVFLPEVKITDLSKKITGKSATKAQDLLSSDGITDVQIVYLRSLPLFPKILPFNKNNIIISSKTE